MISPYPFVLEYFLTENICQSGAGVMGDICEHSMPHLDFDNKQVNFYRNKSQ